MAQAFNVRQFFRRAPREWLKRYFEHEGLLADLDWSKVRTRKIDALLSAWQGLADEDRGRSSDDFKDIMLLATPAGKMQMIDEAEFHHVQQEVAHALGELQDLYDCAFWLKMTHPECWEGAVRFATADNQAKSHWRKRINMPRLGRETTCDDGKALANAIAEIFRRSEGRGDHCFVEQYRRGTREYYFAYPQDHKRTAVEFDTVGSMTKRASRPAFEIIFIHDDAAQTLNIWHEGKMPRVRELQVAFAKAVIGTDIPRESRRDDRVYDLSAFLDPNFIFHPRPELAIASVEVRKLRLRVQGNQRQTINIELGQKTPSHVLARTRDMVTAGIGASLLKVDRIEMLVTFDLDGNAMQPKTRRFTITSPNSCSLELDAHGLVIERMLSDHGIEPKPRGLAMDGAELAPS